MSFEKRLRHRCFPVNFTKLLRTSILQKICKRVLLLLMNLKIWRFTRFFNGSGLDSEEEPHWYQVLNPFFAETHKPLNLVSSAADTLFVNEKYFSDSSLEKHDNDDDDESKPASFSRSDGTDLNELDAEDKQDDDDAPRGILQNVRQADKPPLRKKSKIVKLPHKKSENIKSTTHGLSAIARGINASIAAQDSGFQRQLKENVEREWRFLSSMQVKQKKIANMKREWHSC